MNRSAVKAIGLTLLVVFGLIGLAPFIARDTYLLDNFNAFTWSLGGTTILSLWHSADGASVAAAWSGVWFFAIFGELLLIGVALLSPVRKSRHVVTWRS